MPKSERDLLLRINDQIKKLNTPPPSTFAPQTGEEEKPLEYKPSANPLPAYKPSQK